MSLPALIGFAGVLVAAVATGLLAGRSVRQPRPDTILWTSATLALTIALAAQSIGFASGFSSATFRVVQLFALLLAPLWLAWGLVELVGPNDTVRFGSRLACGALTVVGSVILATDPLTAEAFGKGWPLAGPHYQPPSHYALDVGQAVAVILAAVSVGLAAARARNDGPWPGALPGTAAVGLAVLMTVALRSSLPVSSAYPLLSLLAAALVWFGATRLEAPPARAGTGRARAGTGRARVGTGRGRAAPEATNGHGGSRPPGDLRASGDPARWADSGRRPPAAPPPDWPRSAPGPRPDGRPFVPREPGPDGRQLAPGAPPPGASAPAVATLDAAEAEFGPPAKPDVPAAPPYGRILIFTLLEDRVADFDRLAEQSAEEVRIREPETLVYVIHLVPNAPLQRIFYEIYRDRAAFDRHEIQPYMQRFVAERRACVLATNVIELRLKYAKVAPLPSPQPSSPPAPRAQLPPGQRPPPHRRRVAPRPRRWRRRWPRPRGRPTRWRGGSSSP